MKTIILSDEAIALLNLPAGSTSFTLVQLVELMVENDTPQLNKAIEEIIAKGAPIEVQCNLKNSTDQNSQLVCKAMTAENGTQVVGVFQVA